MLVRAQFEQLGLDDDLVGGGDGVITRAQDVAVAVAVELIFAELIEPDI